MCKHSTSKFTFCCSNKQPPNLNGSVHSKGILFAHPISNVVIRGTLLVTHIGAHIDGSSMGVFVSMNIREYDNIGNTVNHTFVHKLSAQKWHKLLPNFIDQHKF